MLKQVETYEYENEKTKDKLNELNNKLKIEMNDQKHLTENLTQTSKEINNLELKWKKKCNNLVLSLMIKSKALQI